MFLVFPPIDLVGSASRDFLNREDLDSRAELTGCLGHAIDHARAFVLHNRMPSCLAQFEQPQRTIATDPGEERSYRRTPPMTSQTVEQHIRGGAEGVFGRFLGVIKRSVRPYHYMVVGSLNCP
jgi:hypothetical protein